MVLCPHISSEQWSPISLCHIWSDSQFVLHCKAPIKDDSTNTRQSTCSSFWHLCDRTTKPRVQARHMPALLNPGEPLPFFFFFHTQSRQSQTVLPAVGIFCTKWELYVVRGSQNPFCEDMDPWVHTDPPATPPAWTCYVGWWAQAERAWHGNGGGTNRRQLTGGAHHQMHTGARLPFLDTSLREGKRREERRWEEKHRNYSHISVPARAPLPIMLPWGRYKQQQKCTDTEKREREITIKTYNYTPGERAGLNTPLPLNTEGE